MIVPKGIEGIVFDIEKPYSFASRDQLLFNRREARRSTAWSHTQVPVKRI